MIDTDRLTIYPLQQSHLTWLRKMRNDPTTWYWLTDATPINEERQQQWFMRMSTDPTRLYLVIENKELSQPIGILRSDEWDRVNRSIRIGIDIDIHYRRLGYGTEAFRAFIDYLFKHLNLHRIWLLTVDYNEAGQKLYKKLGFKEEGRQRQAIFRDGKYHEYISMSLLEDEWEK